MNQNPRFGGPRGPSNYPSQNNYPNNNQQQGNYNPSTSGNIGWGTKHGNYGTDYNQSGSTNPNYNKPMMNPKGDDFTSKFCTSYQFNQPCKF